ncbi:MAG: alpha/beta hydrolase [Bacteroidetes bacterium]|jgi:pimeloyl-ACP methyl ester carboxylesterase|nr:alpha/beta hydrolase [Bacteroidota bacterium]
MKLAYREFGSGEPLVILHGLFGQSDNWNTLAKQFAEKGFHVFTIDQRNHGLSPHSDTWDYNVMADDLKEFLEDHNLHHAILLGHSMGGKTVLFFEWKYPEVAQKLIVADISPRAYEPHHSDVLEALHAVDFSVVKTRKEAEAKMNEYIKDFGTKQFLLKNIYWKDSDNNVMDWRFNLKVISDNYDNIGVEAPLFKSETPCLIIRGEKSNYVTEKDMEDFRARFIDCKLETVAGSGHWVHAEKPKEFFEVVMGFIK